MDVFIFFDEARLFIVSIVFLAAVIGKAGITPTRQDLDRSFFDFETNQQVYYILALSQLTFASTLWAAVA